MSESVHSEEQQLHKRKSQDSVWLNVTSGSAPTSGQINGHNNVHKKSAHIGVYRGTVVVVRKVNKRSIDLNRTILKELNTVRLKEREAIYDTCRVIGMQPATEWPWPSFTIYCVLCHRRRLRLNNDSF